MWATVSLRVLNPSPRPMPDTNSATSLDWVTGERLVGGDDTRIPVIHNHMVAARKNAPFLDESNEFPCSRLGQHVGIVTEMEIATRRGTRWGKERIGLDLCKVGINGLDDVGKGRFVGRQHASEVNHVGVCGNGGGRGEPPGLPVGLEFDVILHN